MGAGIFLWAFLPGERSFPQKLNAAHDDEAGRRFIRVKYAELLDRQQKGLDAWTHFAVMEYQMGPAGHVRMVPPSEIMSW